MTEEENKRLTALSKLDADGNTVPEREEFLVSVDCVLYSSLNVSSILEWSPRASSVANYNIFYISWPIYAHGQDSCDQ